MNKREGFTLIEMLVVIAVIGILAATVLTSLGPARDKARDTRIISAVNQSRTVMETEYNATDGTYPANPEALSEISNLDSEAQNNGGDLIFNMGAGSRSYAVYSVLNSGDYYCADSSGNTGSAQPAGATCP